MCVPGWDEKARGHGCPVAAGAIAGGPEPRWFYGTGCPQDEAPWMGKTESGDFLVTFWSLKKSHAAGTVDPKKFEE